MCVRDINQVWELIIFFPRGGQAGRVQGCSCYNIATGHKRPSYQSLGPQVKGERWPCEHTLEL